MKTTRYCAWCAAEGKMIETGKYDGKQPTDIGGMCRNHQENIGVAPGRWTADDLREEQERYASMR